jgi:hypothetical protein
MNLIWLRGSGLSREGFPPERLFHPVNLGILGRCINRINERLFGICPVQQLKREDEDD